MFAHHRQKIQLLFAIADAVLTILAFEVAYFTRTRWAIGTLFFLRPEPHILLLAFCAAVWISLGFLGRVYEYMDSANPRQLLAKTLRQCGSGVVLVIIFQYLLRIDPPLSRSFLLLFFGFSLILLALFRWYSPNLIGAFQRGFGSPYHLVIVGSPEKAATLEQHLCRNSPFRIEIIARIGEADCAERLPQLLRKKVVDEVIFDVDSRVLPALEEVFLQCDEEGVRTRVAIDFFPHVNSDITLDRVGGAPLLTFSAAPLDDLRLVLKRLFDIAVSATALVALFPFLALVAVVIKLTSSGPVIFRQSRCGLNGRRFTMYKFRSMVENSTLR